MYTQNPEFIPKGFTIPMVEQRDGNRTMVYDLFSLLMKESRIVQLGLEINPFTTHILTAQLLYLGFKDTMKDGEPNPVKLYINSPGGDIVGGVAIMDTMNLVKAPVHTYCIGQCASMAAVLLACGQKGHRYAAPSSRIIIHQPWGGVGGQQTDIMIQAKEILRMREYLEKVLAERTGQSLTKVHTDCERDFIMTAQEALEYGIVDHILEKKV